MKAEGSKQSLTWVASTEQGRRFLWDMLSFCGVYQDLAGEPNDVFKSLGKREVGLHMLGLLADIDDELIFNMMREAKNRSIEQEIENDNRSDNTDNDNDLIRSIIGDTSYHTSSDDSDDALSEYGSGGAIL